MATDVRFGVQLLAALTALLLASGANADSPDAVRVQITDPYIEMRTGFGRAYPVFHVVERGRWIDVRKRHTDWFQVATERGVVGWVHREQLERTLTEAGVATTFRDVLLDDFLAQRLEVGMAGGFADGDPVAGAHIGYVLHDNFAVELSLSRISGSFSTSTLWHANLVSIPVPGKRYVPFFTLGVGRFKNVPRTTLVNAEDIEAPAINAGVGLRVYVTRRFVVRADYKNYAALVSDDRTTEIREYLLGLSFFF